jgi:putative membrane protein (TIGR04086 family)
MIGWDAVRAGAALAVAVMLGTFVLVEVVDATVGLDRESNWLFLFYALVVAGLVAGGWLAGQRRTDAPVTHGAVAALAAYVVVAALVAIIRATMDRGPDPVALLFNALMASSAGIVGGLLAGRRP